MHLPSRQQRGCAAHTDGKIPPGLIRSQLQWINLLVRAIYIYIYIGCKFQQPEKSLPLVLWYTGSAIWFIALPVITAYKHTLQATSPSLLMHLLSLFPSQGTTSLLASCFAYRFIHPLCFVGFFIVVNKKHQTAPTSFRGTFAQTHKCFYNSLLSTYNVICLPEKHRGTREQLSRIPVLSAGCAYFCLVSSSFCWLRCKSKLHG